MSNHPISSTGKETIAVSEQPDSGGHFNAYGGRYVAETLMPALIELEAAYKNAQADPAFDG